MKPMRSTALLLSLLLVPVGAWGSPVLVGLQDNFESPAEILSPSPELSASVADFGGTQDLDLVAGVGLGVNNRQVAHTFTDLPDGIIRAWLELRVRGGNDPGVTSDGIFLTFVDATTVYYADAIAWSRSFGPVSATPPYYPLADPTGLVGAWGPGHDATITLELHALPIADGTILNLTPWMSRNGFLDVNVSDETGCDYFYLTYEIGPVDAPVAAPLATAGLDLRSFPNPCRGATALSFTLDQPGPATLTVYDVCGRRVQAFERGDWAVGLNRLDWAATDARGEALPPGTYFVRLETRNAADTHKVVILR